jgi:hypothetical protein
MLNQIFNLSVHFIWECIFGDSEFALKYRESRKFFNFTSSSLKWFTSNKNGLPKRKLDYHVELGAFGKAKNIEEQVESINV